MDAGSGDERQGRGRRRRRRGSSASQARPRSDMHARPLPPRGSSVHAAGPEPLPAVELEALAPLAAPLEPQTSAHAWPHEHSGGYEPEAEPSGRRDHHTGKRRASGEVVFGGQHEEQTGGHSPVAVPAMATVEGASAGGNSASWSYAPGVGSLGQQRRGEEAFTPVAELQASSHWAGPSSPSDWTSPLPSARRERAAVARARERALGPARPIANATRNIDFAMLQPHFEGSLQDAAASFGVCTTLLKKICRRNGIKNWPHRKILGLRKSIASMAKQVHYFDGEQKRAYAEQLDKLQRELQAYLRTANPPTDEFLRQLDAEAEAEAHSQAEAGEGRQEALLGGDDEEKTAEVVVGSAWAARPSVLPSLPGVAQQVEESATGRRRETVEDWRQQPRELAAQPPAAPGLAVTAPHQLPSIAFILRHQDYSSPSRAAATTTLPPDARLLQYPPQQYAEQQQYGHPYDRFPAADEGEEDQ